MVKFFGTDPELPVKLYSKSLVLVYLKQNLNFNIRALNHLSTPLGLFNFFELGKPSIESKSNYRKSSYYIPTTILK